jgi:predicted AAA+ superfamily ATPase
VEIPTPAIHVAGTTYGDSATIWLILWPDNTARLINVSDLAAPFQLSRQTIHDYVTVLERVFLLERLAPWHNNRLSRLVKTPKLHMGDTGLACALMGIDAATLLKERERLGRYACCWLALEILRGRRQRDFSAWNA